MQFIYEILSFNRILTVSLLAWFVAQVLKTLINFILLSTGAGAHVGDGGAPVSAQRHRCLRNGCRRTRCEGIDSAIFAVACVVAIITMHDAMGVRHDIKKAKVLNQMIDRGSRRQRKERLGPAEHVSGAENGRPYSAAGGRGASGGPWSASAVCWVDVKQQGRNIA